MTNAQQDTTQVEEMLQKAGNRLSKSSAATPSRDILQSALQSARTASVDVTNPAPSRYSLRRACTDHMRVFISATVAVVLLLIIGSGLYLKSSHMNSSSSASQSLAINTSPTQPTPNGSGAPGQPLMPSQSDQNIDQSVSQIDSQMNGLADDNNDVDQSTAQAAQ